MKPSEGSDSPGVTVDPKPLVLCFLQRPLFCDTVSPLLVLWRVMLIDFLEARWKERGRSHTLATLLLNVM